MLGQDSFAVVDVPGDELLIGVFGGDDQLEQAVDVLDSGRPVRDPNAGVLRQAAHCVYAPDEYGT